MLYVRRCETISLSLVLNSQFHAKHLAWLSNQNASFIQWCGSTSYLYLVIKFCKTRDKVVKGKLTKWFFFLPIYGHEYLQWSDGPLCFYRAHVFIRFSNKNASQQIRRDKKYVNISTVLEAISQNRRFLFSTVEKSKTPNLRNVIG